MARISGMLKTCSGDHQVTPNESECMYYLRIHLYGSQDIGWMAFKTIFEICVILLTLMLSCKNVGAKTEKRKKSSQNFQHRVGVFFIIFTKVVFFKG